MPTFALLTRLAPDAVRSPAALEELEVRAMEHVRRACPSVEWLGSHGVLGPYDYLDLFHVPELDDASRISALIRTYGHATTEVWPLTEWGHFKGLIRGLGIVQP